MQTQTHSSHYGVEQKCAQFLLFRLQMGLGKTLQALSAAYYFRDEWPLLIVVPSSLRYPWIDEVEKWFPEINPEHINLIQNGADIQSVLAHL